MDAQKVDLFLMTNNKMFLPQHIPVIKEKLMSLDESKVLALQSMDFKDPTTLLIISIFLGSFGVDRFMLGDTGMGVLKLLTGGLCGILTIIDWCTIQKKTRELNYNNVMAFL
ncbi:MAG: TM2 domain-containing protein [Oscillospiraceae bacterium]|nr:TM2 domain-containing protein [Oscillospiraceae bacterium]